MKLSGEAGASRVYTTTIQLVHLLHKYLLSTYYALGPAQGRKDKRDMIPAPTKLVVGTEETGAQALRGMKSHVLDLAFHIVLPQEVPQLFLPTSLSH